MQWHVCIMLHFATEPSSIRWMVAMNAHLRPNEVNHHFFYVQCFNLPIIYSEIVIKFRWRGQILGNCNIPINYPTINLFNPTHWHKLAQLQFIFCYNSNQGVRNHTDSTQARLLTQRNKIYLLKGFKEWGYAFYRT